MKSKLVGFSAKDTFYSIDLYKNEIVTHYNLVKVLPHLELAGIKALVRRIGKNDDGMFT